jgi:hypothetical protein
MQKTIGPICANCTGVAPIHRTSQAGWGYGQRSINARSVLKVGTRLRMN